MNKLKSLKINHQKYDYPFQGNRQKSQKLAHRMNGVLEPARHTNDQLKDTSVLQMQDYIDLQGVLTNKIHLLQENIEIYRQKNRLKDKEILTYVISIERKNERLKQLEAKLQHKENKLKKLSIKCHDKTHSISEDQQKIKREQIFYLQENAKCQQLTTRVNQIHEAIAECQKQFERRKKVYENLLELQEEIEKSKEKLHQLQNEEKLWEYRQTNEKKQLCDLQKKIKELAQVCKDREEINKKNQLKLRSLKHEISNLSSKKLNLNQQDYDIKSLELEIGELNQQLLLLNNDLGQLQSKTIRKKQSIQEALNHKESIKHFPPKPRTKTNNNDKKENYKVIESEEDESKLKQKSRVSSQQNSARTMINSRKQSPSRNNETPTFTENQRVASESQNMKYVDDNGSNEAGKNIQKLIMRYQQIRNRQKLKN